MPKMVKKQTLRDKAEQRNVKTSIKMTEREREIIEKKSREHGMSVSRYLSYAGVNLGNMSPADKVQIQNIFNKVYDTIVEICPEMAEYIEKGMNKLWSL
ncbi:MAG: hypothetical protein NC320_11960 [Clostridium sp.]|nr:hypothetical protein [Clostridium sp.]